MRWTSPFLRRTVLTSQTKVTRRNVEKTVKNCTSGPAAMESDVESGDENLTNQNNELNILMEQYRRQRDVGGEHDSDVESFFTAEDGDIVCKNLSKKRTFAECYPVNARSRLTTRPRWYS